MSSEAWEAPSSSEPNEPGSDEELLGSVQAALQRLRAVTGLEEPSCEDLIGALEELRSCLEGLGDGGAFEAAAADGALAAELAALLGACLPQRLATLLGQAGGVAAADAPTSAARALIRAQFAGLCFVGDCCKLPQRSRWAAEVPAMACGLWATCDLVVAAGMTGGTAELARSCMRILHHNFPHLSDEAGSLHASLADRERAEVSPGHTAELVQRLKLFLDRLAPDLKALSAPGALATLSDSALEEAREGLMGTVCEFPAAGLTPGCCLAPSLALDEEGREELLRLIVGPATAALQCLRAALLAAGTRSEVGNMVLCEVQRLTSHLIVHLLPWMLQLQPARARPLPAGEARLWLAALHTLSAAAHAGADGGCPAAAAAPGPEWELHAALCARHCQALDLLLRTLARSGLLEAHPAADACAPGLLNTCCAYAVEAAEQLLRLAGKAGLLQQCWHQAAPQPAPDHVAGLVDSLVATCANLLSCAQLQAGMGVLPSSARDLLGALSSLMLTAGKMLRQADDMPAGPEMRGNLQAILFAAVLFSCELVGAGGLAPGIFEEASGSDPASNQGAKVRAIFPFAVITAVQLLLESVAADLGPGPGRGGPAPARVKSEQLLKKLCASLPATCLLLLARAGLVEEAGAAGAGALLTRHLESLLATGGQEIGAAAFLESLAGLCVQPGCAPLAAAVAREGLLARITEWCSRASMRKDGNDAKAGVPAFKGGRKLLPAALILMRAAAWSLDAATASALDSAHSDLLEGVYLPAPAAVRTDPWFELRSARRNVWLRAASELLPDVLEAGGLLAPGRGGGEAAAMAAHDTALAAAGACCNPACANLCGAREALVRVACCARCGLAAWCCRTCQSVDEQRHKAYCRPAAGNSGGVFSAEADK